MNGTTEWPNGPLVGEIASVLLERLMRATRSRAELSFVGELAAVAARVACEQLLARFHASIDAGAATDGAPLFTPDAVIDLPAGSARGSEAIARLLSAREAESGRVTVHALGSFDFRLASDREARASGALVVYAGRPENVNPVPEALSRYAARFRRTDRGWRICRLEVELVGVGAETRG